MKSVYWLLVSVIMIIANIILWGMESSWNSILWLIGFVVLLGAEVSTMDLTTLWFALGALAAYLFSLLGVGFGGQLLVFNLVSLALLAFVRPASVKMINENITPTNKDSLIGLEVLVLEEISNHSGLVMVNGIEWLARASNKSEMFPVDSMVEVVGIEGVKLLVKKLN